MGCTEPGQVLWLLWKQAGLAAMHREREACCSSSSTGASSAPGEPFGSAKDKQP